MCRISNIPLSEARKFEDARFTASPNPDRRRFVIGAWNSRWKVCAEAANGQEAVQKAVELKPDLIIIDLQMPALDGLAASARIVRSLPRTPILMNTLHKSKYLDLEAAKAGIRAVIAKSDAATLLRAVERLLGGAPESTAPQSNEVPV